MMSGSAGPGWGYAGAVLDHFESPRNIGNFAFSQHVGTGTVGDPKTGIVRIQVRVGAGVVLDARFKAHGCGYTIAAASYATEWVKGKSLDEARRMTPTVLADELDMPAERFHCALLVEDAVKTALQHYALTSDSACDHERITSS